jgi:hypothetical protein
VSLNEEFIMRRLESDRVRQAALAVVAAVVAAGFAVSQAAASQLTSQSKTVSHVALRVPVSGSGGFNYTQGSYLEGFEFTATRPITVTALGAYDSSLSKLPNGAARLETVPVALFDISKHVFLRQVTVTSSDPATGVYRYAALSRRVTLNTTDKYAVAWVSLGNYYIASPKLTASAVDPTIKYVAMAGYGPGGLTTTSEIVEPNWFFTKSAHGLSAINYDLGPNFTFTTPS